MKKALPSVQFDQPVQQTSSNKTQFLLDGKYQLQVMKQTRQQYIFYEGIDTQTYKSKHLLQIIKIILWQAKSNILMSKGVKQIIRNQLCPKVIWSGQQKRNDILTYFQVHQTYGPSLKKMFDYIDIQWTQKQLLHLLYQMIKLIQRLSNAKLVSGELDPNLIIFNCNPKKTQLFLLNCFTLKKVHTQSKPICSKYCSINMHFRRKISVKDDLQSICYILIDLYTQGKFLNDKYPFQYKQQKMREKTQFGSKKLPKIFIQFYTYVRSINQNKDTNFTHWKAVLSKALGYKNWSQPYNFMMTKSQKSIQTYSKILVSQTEISNIEDNQDQLKQDEAADKQGNIKKLRRTIIPKLLLRATDGV